MILTPSPPPPGSAADRLLRALAGRGHAVGTGRADAGTTTLFFCPGPQEALPDASAWVRTAAPGLRLLVVTRLGTHPDAVAPRLRECWALEECARASGLPTLVLRPGPMLGPASPTWVRLRSGPALPRGGAKLVNPVAEADVVETLHRALAGLAPWEGWYEVAGPEVWSLAELADLARSVGPPQRRPVPGWEPPLGEIEEHRLAEAGPWLSHFGLTPRPLAERAREWAAAPAGSMA